MGASGEKVVEAYVQKQNPGRLSHLFALRDPMKSKAKSEFP